MSDDLTRMSRSRRPTRRSKRSTAIATLSIAGALFLGACGSDGASNSTPLSGIVRDPAPSVDLVSLPSLTNPGEDVEFRAASGHVMVVYFGFTNCPDVCPTTLADLSIALRRLEPEQAASVDVVMATVDPGRDLDVLPGYIASFVPDGVAVGTADLDRLTNAGEPFGASWEVRTVEDGQIEVDHSPFLYAVDDQGKLVLTWQFGASSQDLANDLSILLTRNQEA